MYKLVLILFVSLLVNANELYLKNGQIKAHTEVFGDSTIDPQTKKIDVRLSKKQDIESIKGIFEIETLSLVSDNKDRDQHMYEVLNVKLSPKISFEISSINKNEEKYEIKGLLKMNNIYKQIDSLANITQNNNDISINGDFSINLTDFLLEPPTMFFLTVRDQIDITYNFNLKEK
ncbi:YceI family protein [Arcobacter arenosus]|uniref:YceI family protein n=1 Tax=Arcobacter arenosus TaxID=2576037 RepID=A0A5R8Y1M9_9BACT|nr:YceI family protein [Arcobacter arenosus]TLP39182.1 YceI family protein [Arcobacter arenosus]